MSAIKDFLKPNPNAKTKQGYYTPTYPEKYKGNIKKISYRSSWELKFMRWLDLSQDVIEWSSEPFSIKYFYIVDNKTHDYYPDFYFAYRKQDNKIYKYIVEVKPTNQLKKPDVPKRKTKKAIDNYNYLMECYLKNLCKKKYAEKWCDDNGYNYVYVNENSNLPF